jgi:mono/diheme cytochrome c family protein
MKDGWGLTSRVMTGLWLGLGVLVATGCGRHGPAFGPDAAPETSPAHGAAGQAEFALPVMNGSDSFHLNCSACHGPEGDGTGRAAPNLYPKPRNLLHGGFRLVSTTNSVPTEDDLRAVIVRGMPGSSMLSHPHLTEQQVSLLVQEVRRIRRQAVGQQIRTFLLEDTGGEEPEEGEVEAVVDARLTPGPVLRVPAFGPAEDITIAYGQRMFEQQVCQTCHGPEGRGDGQVYLTDDEGYAVLPRDLVYGVFRGGHEPEAVYLRLALGMPGTPMPASVALTESDLMALVHYLGWLSREPKPPTTNYQRSLALLGR